MGVSSTLTSFVIPNSYGGVLLTAVLICFHYSLHVIPISKARKKYFNKEFFKENFPGINAAKSGYPDTGNGHYAARLSPTEWIAFNNAQRVHLNYLENLVPHLTFLLTTGIMYPRFAVVLGWVFMIGRTLYTIGYLRHGPEGRRIGARVAGTAHMLLALAAVATSYQLGGGIQGFITLLRG